PPPTISWSTLPTRLVSSSSLVETLLPATMASSGRAGLASALSSASSSAISSGPPAATGAKRITPWVEAWARCAVPKASMTNTSHSAAYFFASASSSLPSPTFMRQFSSSTTWPGLTSTPSTQSFTSGTSTPSSSDRRAATGASESASLHWPSLGRPRCEVTITAAPFSSASLSVGTEAVMRCSEVMRPLSIGTLRSWRISTRLPVRSRSVIRMIVMLTSLCGGSRWVAPARRAGAGIFRDGTWRRQTRRSGRPRRLPQQAHSQQRHQHRATDQQRPQQPALPVVLDQRLQGALAGQLLGLAGQVGRGRLPVGATLGAQRVQQRLDWRLAALAAGTAGGQGVGRLALGQEHQYLGPVTQAQHRHALAHRGRRDQSPVPVAHRRGQRARFRARPGAVVAHLVGNPGAGAPGPGSVGVLAAVQGPPHRGVVRQAHVGALHREASGQAELETLPPGHAATLAAQLLPIPLQ